MPNLNRKEAIVPEALMTPSLEPSVLEAALEICEVVGQSVEADRFRDVHYQLGALGESVGYGMGTLNFPQPRILGDIRTLQIWESVKAEPVLPIAPTHPYIRALTDVFVPILSVEAVACQFKDIYYPGLLIDERLNDSFSSSMPVGVGLFLDQRSHSGVLWSHLPRALRPYLPEQLAREAAPGNWRSFRDALPHVHSAGGKLRGSLQELLRALSGSLVAQTAQQAARRVLSHSRTKAELVESIVQFHSELRTRHGAGHMTLGGRAQFEADFVERAYGSSNSAVIRGYFEAVRAFERQVELVNACIAQATMRWPFLDISLSEMGPVSLMRQGSTYLTRICLTGDELEELTTLLDVVVRFDRQPYPARGIHIIRSSSVEWRFQDSTTLGSHLLEWLGTGH